MKTPKVKTKSSGVPAKITSRLDLSHTERGAVDLPESLTPVVVMSLCDRLSAEQHRVLERGSTSNGMADEKSLPLADTAPADSFLTNLVTPAAKSTQSATKAKSARSSKTPKTSKQSQKAKDTPLSEADISATPTSRRKSFTKPRAPRKKKDPADGQPKPRRVRKKSGTAVSSHDAAGLEDVACSTPSARSGAGDGEKSVSSTPSSARSKVRFPVRRKGRLAVQSARRRRARAAAKVATAPAAPSTSEAPRRRRKNGDMKLVPVPIVIDRSAQLEDPAVALSNAVSAVTEALAAEETPGPSGSRADDLPPENLDDPMFDQEIERKATKAKISVRNVKHIIKSIISNEQVLAMMRYEESRARDPEGTAARPPSLEPKMTRSRARQLLADCQLPLTPVKRASSSTERLILQEFPEDDDDDEYTPLKEGDESVLTSSICSSPTPSSPCSVSVCSSQPQTPRTPGSVVSEAEEPEEPPSRRTRSRLPLNDMALEELERLLVAPDVTPDMYDVPVDDEDDDWVRFLRDFSAPPAATADAPEEEEDEEYVYQLNEEDEVEREEMREDPAVRIPQKEVNKLMLELMKDVDELQWTPAEPPPGPNVLSNQPLRVPRPEPPAMTESHARQLDRQMAAHVQLLTQTHLLCSEHDWLKGERAGCAALLVELNSLSSALHPEDPSRSFFQPPNLAPALQLVSEVDSKSQEELAENPSKFFNAGAGRRKYVRLSDRLVDQMLSSRAFVYPDLLPLHCAVLPEDIDFRRWTSPAVDQLIAMGLDMFMTYLRSTSGVRRPPSETGAYRLMAKYMLPMNRQRIRNRVDHVRRNVTDAENPIRFYIDKHRAPPVPIVATLPVYPLKPLRERLKDLPEPWHSIAVRGNSFFLATGDRDKVRAVTMSSKILDAIHPPPPRVPRPCAHCMERGFEQRYARSRWQQNEDGQWVLTAKRVTPPASVYRDRSREKPRCRIAACMEAKAAARNRQNATEDEEEEEEDILARCMPTIADSAPTSPAGEGDEAGDSDDAMDVDDPEPSGSALPVAEEQRLNTPLPQATSASAAATRSRLAAPVLTGRKTLLTDASNGEELVSVVNEDPPTPAAAGDGDGDGDLSEPGSSDSRPSSGLATSVTMPTSSGPVRLTPAEGSVIELKEEDGGLVVYIRGRGRPTLRVPVRASPGATRLLLPPTLVLQETGAGRPTTPGTQKQTGVVTPTVRQQEPPSPPLPPPTPPERMDPLEPLEQPDPPSELGEMADSVDGPPAPPPPDLTEPTALLETPSPPAAERHLFKEPFAPSHKLRRSPRFGKLPAAPTWGVITEVFSVTSTTSAVSDGGAPTNAGGAAGDASSGTADAAAGGTGNAGVMVDSGADGGCDSAASRGVGAESAGAGAVPEPPAPDSVVTSQPASMSAPALSEVPAMIPPSLMTPLRRSSPPPESGILLGFPTPSMTPAPGSEIRDPVTPARAMLETPLVRSPPAHALLETPQPRGSPPRSPHTPPGENSMSLPPPPQLAGSSDSHSTTSLSFFSRTIGNVRAAVAEAAQAATGQPGQYLTAEQSLGGVLDALLTRPSEEHGDDRQPPPSSTTTTPAMTMADGPLKTEVHDDDPDPPTPSTADTEPTPARETTATAAATAAAAQPATTTGGRSQGVRTRSESASGSTPQRAAQPPPPPPPDTKPALPAEAAEETAAQAEEDRELTGAAALPAGRSSRPKRSRQQREAELTRQALAPESPDVRERREHALAQSFFQRVKDCTESVDPLIYEHFQKLLLDFAESPDDEAGLYDSVCRILRGFPDLASEFVMFLSADVAVKRGLVTEHARAVRLQELARGIDAVNAAHPAQVLKLARTLTQMTSRGEEVRAADLQAAVQPLLRGCPLLAAQLSSLIDSEPPQAELTRREADFQTAALDAEGEDDGFEEVTELEADEPDPYGTERCPCACHDTGEDVRFLQRRRHCERCGLRFMAGRVYLQTGKVLRPAMVVSCSEEAEETATTSTGPDPGDGSPPAKRQRKRTVSRGRRPRTSSSSAARAASPPPPAPAPAPAPSTSVSVSTQDPSPMATEPVPPPPPPPAPAPSEQAPCADSTDPSAAPGPSDRSDSDLPDSSDPAPWSRDDDLEILTSCQRSGDGEKTFRAIQRRLPSRSVAQLRGRFQELMEMLRQQLQQEPDELLEDEL